MSNDVFYELRDLFKKCVEIVEELDDKAITKHSSKKLEQLREINRRHVADKERLSVAMEGMRKAEREIQGNLRIAIHHRDRLAVQVLELQRQLKKRKEKCSVKAKKTRAVRAKGKRVAKSSSIAAARGLCL